MLAVVAFDTMYYIEDLFKSFPSLNNKHILISLL